MSKLLEARVWQSGLAADLKPLAALLADIGGDDGSHIYPSVEYMGWVLGRSRRAVQGQIARLLNLGILITVCHVEPAGPCRGLAHGQGETIEYHLAADALPSRPPWAATPRRVKGCNACTLIGAKGCNACTLIGAKGCNACARS